MIAFSRMSSRRLVTWQIGVEFRNLTFCWDGCGAREHVWHLFYPISSLHGAPCSMWQRSVPENTSKEIRWFITCSITSEIRCQAITNIPCNNVTIVVFLITLILHLGARPNTISIEFHRNPMRISDSSENQSISRSESKISFKDIKGYIFGYEWISFLGMKG